MRRLTFDLAHKALAEGVKKAPAEFGRPVCVAVCDETGNLLAFCRMDDAPLRSIAISMSKAYTACRMGVNTDAFFARLQREHLAPADFCDGKFTSLPGGAVIKSKEGAVLGGIGISGLKAEEDQVVADALARLCEEELNG